MTWAALTRHPAPVLSWAELPSVADVYTDGWTVTRPQITVPVVGVARRYLHDLAGSFSYAYAAEALRIGAQTDRWQVGGLTPVQARPVVNALGGILHEHRRRLFRADRAQVADGPPCLVCGGPLTDALSAARGLGPTCYRLAIRGGL